MRPEIGIKSLRKTGTYLRLYAKIILNHGDTTAQRDMEYTIRGFSVKPFPVCVLQYLSLTTYPLYTYRLAHLHLFSGLRQCTGFFVSFEYDDIIGFLVGDQ